MLYRVMIVDDESISRQYIRSLIDWEKEGFLLCAEAQNTQEAMSFIKLYDIQIVLLDVFMPEQNGVALSAMIRQYYPGVAMLAISSFDDYDYVRDILKNGAYDYILKHRLNPDTLLGALSSIRNKLDCRQIDSSVSTDERRGRARQALRHFLSSNGDPHDLEVVGLVKPGTRFVITAVKVANLKTVTDNYSDEEKKLLEKAIISILEEDTALKNTAVSYGDGAFLVFQDFTDIVSEAKIQSAVSLFRMKVGNTLHMLFSLDIDSASSDVLLTPEELTQAREALDARIEQEKIGMEKGLNIGQRAKNPVISLSIRHRKQLFQAIDDGNIPAMQQILSEIYGGMAPEDDRGRLLITKELYEILLHSASELGLHMELAFKGNELFEWAQVKSTDEIQQYLEALFRQVLLKVMQKMQNRQCSDYVRRAILYISDHFAKPIGLNIIASWVGVSAPYLSRLFSREMGMTLVEYINQYRVEMSKQYMHQGLNLKEISGRVGFKNYNYFFTVFKEYEGLTPIEYMRKSNNQSISIKN